MRKLAFNGLLAGITLAVVLTSCSKDDVQVPLSPGTASVSGRLTANLDETDFQIQSVPQGTGITFVISGADLDRNPQLGYNYEDVVVRGTTNADGRYSVSLPAAKNAINVDVIFDDFEYDATILTTDEEGFQTAVTERRTFSRIETSISIVEGQVQVKDYAYNTGIGSFVPTATVRGVVEAQFFDNIGAVGLLGSLVGGSGYQDANGIPVTGGTGSGLTVNIITNMGEVINWAIANSGSGYTVGDVLTISTGGNNATFQVVNVSPTTNPVPEGVLLTFTVGGSPYKVFTNSDGEYIVKLPADSGDSDMTGADFEATSVYFENGIFVTGMKIYSFATVGQIGLAEGSIIELDLDYSRSN